MNGYGTITRSDADACMVRFERLLPGPIERVWTYLTDSDKRGTWLATGAMEPRVGGRIDLHFLHADLAPEPETIPERYKDLEHGASFTGRVTRYDPPRVLSHTWEGFGENSEVTYELSTRGDHVLLVLTHRRLDGQELVSVASGWHTHLDILVDRLSDKVPGPFWAAHERAAAVYQQSAG